MDEISCDLRMRTRVLALKVCNGDAAKGLVEQGGIKGGTLEYVYETTYTVNVLSAESTDKCLRTKSQDN